MLLEQKLEQVKLSSAQNEVVHYLLKMRDHIKDMTVKEIAEATYTSTGTVIRLTKKLGYNGYEDFKNDFLKEIYYLDTHFQNINPNIPFDREDNIQKIASKITMLAQETMEDTLSLIDHDSLQKATWLLKNAKHIHLAAISYSLFYGQIFRLDMARIGKQVNVCDVSGEELFLPAVVSNEDVVIIISYSGQIEKLCTLAKMLKKMKVSIIVITSLGDNELKKYADVVLSISTREKLYSKIKGYSNENSIKLILDILYSCYFAIDYEKNLKRKIEVSKNGEIGRISSLEVMKED